MLEKIKVAAFDFELKHWDAHQGSDQRKFGECSSFMQEIRVDETLKPVKYIDTLLHETLHAIFWAYGVEDEDNEERIVGTVATALTQVFRDNPQLLDLIKDKLDV